VEASDNWWSYTVALPYCHLDHLCAQKIRLSVEALASFPSVDSVAFISTWPADDDNFNGSDDRLPFLFLGTLA
jgi:hypothetical protein